MRLLARIPSGLALSGAVSCAKLYNGPHQQPQTAAAAASRQAVSAAANAFQMESLFGTNESRAEEFIDDNMRVL